ncbi:hypothetical protein EU527_03480 [Candidatus Thorarchaeota archaeon]|nr:MAG: hypothetical protein EU527_03480 [Candidatus Thorarchaeota archaeon]
MISRERTQNIIIASTIIVAIISSTFLVSNATYYAGTYTLLGRFSITFEELIISDLDPLDNTTEPHLQFRFNIATDSQYKGNVRITFMGFTPTLNYDELSYTPFSIVLPVDEQYLTPNYTRELMFNNTASDELGIDRQTIWDAYESGIWFWQVEFRYSYIFFDAIGTVDFAYQNFNITEVTII